MRPRLRPNLMLAFSSSPSVVCQLLLRPFACPPYRAPWHLQAGLAHGGAVMCLQKRGITKQHLRRTKEAEEQWDQWACEIREGKRQSFFKMLEERGLVNSVVGDRDALDNLFTTKRVGVYVGVDPTAPSIHIGHMLPLMVLAWCYVHGIKAVFLLGGSTGQIGDPTGRTTEREKMINSVRKANIVNMHLQLRKLGVAIENYGKKYGYTWEWAWRRELINNNVWWNKVPMLEVLKVIGSWARMGPMLGRDTVKTRMSRGEGMSFSEFCYPIMQAWDWWHLFQHGVKVQVGGSDQFGNILFGIDMIKRIIKEQNENPTDSGADPKLSSPMGFTTPLLTNSAGEKIGKSAGNAVWLDKDITSTLELYQHFVRTSDDDVERYLKLFTFLPLPRISELMEAHRQDPSKSMAQHILAYEFVELVHGFQEAEKAQEDFRRIFNSESPPATQPSSPSPNLPKSGFWNPRTDPKAPQTNHLNMPSPNITLPRSLVVGQPFHKILWSAGMVSSRTEGHRVIANKGAAVGSKSGSGTMTDGLSYMPIKTWPGNETEKFIIDKSLLILRIGKWKVKVVKIVSDEEFEDMGLDVPGWKEAGSAPEITRVPS